MATEPPLATELVKPPTISIVLPLTVHDVIGDPLTEQAIGSVTVTILGNVTLKLAPFMGF